MNRSVVTHESWLDLRTVVEGASKRMMEADVDLQAARRSFEDEFVSIIVEKLNGDRDRAARVLGISRSRLREDRIPGAGSTCHSGVPGNTRERR